MFKVALFAVAKTQKHPSTIDEWMCKQYTIDPYNGNITQIRKEGNSDTCYIMYEPWGHYAT